MSDPLIQELEDAEKHEKMMALWDEYGSYLIAAALLTILFTGLFTGYNTYRTNMHERQTAALVSALEADERSAALSAVAPDLNGGLRAIADLSAAGSLLVDEKPEEALAIYEKAAGDQDLPDKLRDLSGFMAVRIGWDIDSRKDAADRRHSDDEYLQNYKPYPTKQTALGAPTL